MTINIPIIIRVPPGDPLYDIFLKAEGDVLKTLAIALMHTVANGEGYAIGLHDEVTKTDIE